MDLDFLSGLLLTLVTLAIVGYLIVAIVGSRDRDSKKLRHGVSVTLKKITANDSKPINDHLIGATGRVIGHSDDTARPIRVRINLELWPARLSSTQVTSPAIDASVTVIAVDGPVLVVEATTDAA